MPQRGVKYHCESNRERRRLGKKNGIKGNPSGVRLIYFRPGTLEKTTNRCLRGKRGGLEFHNPREKTEKRKKKRWNKPPQAKGHHCGRNKGVKEEFLRRMLETELTLGGSEDRRFVSKLLYAEKTNPRDSDASTYF